MATNDWLSTKPSGRYYLYKAPDSNATYSAFIPNPLCEDLSIAVDAELMALLSTANRLLGLLEGMSTFLPNATAIKNIFLYKEALLSCQIDGIDAPFYELIDVSRKDDNKISPVKNYVSAMAYGLGKLASTHYDNHLLCEIHKVLMGDTDSEDCGCFRKKPTLIGKIAHSSTPIYNPTSPDKLPSVLKDLEKFICRNDDLDVIIKVALAHYQFETIHPFMTGNGRIGRILSYLLLFENGIFTSPIISLSLYLNMNKVEYIDRMESLHHKQDYEQWIKFFTRSVIFAADDALSSTKKWLDIREKNLGKIADCGKSIKAIRTVYDLIEQYPIIDVNTLAGKAEISYNTGAAALNLLCKLDIVKQSNNMARNRDYAYAGFLDCFIGADMLSQPTKK